MHARLSYIPSAKFIAYRIPYPIIIIYYTVWMHKLNKSDQSQLIEHTLCRVDNLYPITNWWQSLVAVWHVYCTWSISLYWFMSYIKQSECCGVGNKVPCSILVECFKDQGTSQPAIPQEMWLAMSCAAVKCENARSSVNNGQRRASKGTIGFCWPNNVTRSNLCHI